MSSALTTIELDWQARRRTRRAATLWYGALLLCAIAISAYVSEVFPETLARGLPQIGVYFRKLVPALTWEHLFDGPKTEGAIAYWFYRLDSWGWMLFETTQIAALATLFGACGALLGCFGAAANLAPNRATYLICRRILELFRTVPDIVYALILVYALGVGPPAGIFAIALHTTGALGKLFAEVVENADMRPWDGVRAAGGTWLHGVRFAILPQVMPNFLSYLLLRFEINVRGSTVIGFVGAGGIGQELYLVIAKNYYDEIGAIIALIILTVAFIDIVSERLRSRVIGT